MSRSVSICLAFVAGMGMFSAAGWALDKPAGEPILEITGKIDNTNGPNSAVFDRAMLEGLGSATIVTKTPWHSGEVTFEGVPLAKLMDTVKAQGKSVKAVALNDYAVTIPIDDFAKFGVILAYKRGGEYMPVRDKGPLFVIYPYDSNPDLQAQLYYARSAWQVKRLEIQD